MSSQTVLPSPATIAPSHEVIAASGVDWSTATGVAAVVESPVAVPDVAPDVVADVVSDGADEVEVLDAGGVVLEEVPVVSVALLHAASETERAIASAAVESFFMGGSLPDGGE
jgi:hypothetical protein